MFDRLLSFSPQHSVSCSVLVLIKLKMTHFLRHAAETLSAVKNDQTENK
jgi:hypothetical protein